MTDLLLTSEKTWAVYNKHQTIPILSLLIPLPCYQLFIVRSGRISPFSALIPQICITASFYPARSDERPFLFAMNILKKKKKKTETKPNQQTSVERVQCRYLKMQLLTAASFPSRHEDELPLVADSLPWAIALISLTSDEQML